MGRRGFWTNDGGSAHTASFTDALSSDISRFTMEAGRNRKRFPASPPGSVKSSAYCASTRHSLFTLPSLPFSLILCYVLLHRPVPEGYGRIIRRLGSGRPVVDLTSYRYTDSIFLLRMWSGRRPVKEDIHTLRKDAETGLRKRSRFGLAQKAEPFFIPYGEAENRNAVLVLHHRYPSDIRERASAHGLFARPYTVVCV